jgi:two-component system phosphate regulon sensor histidine kinase PhoR
LKRFYYDQIGSTLEDRAYLIKDQVSGMLLSGKIQELRTFCRKSGREASTRITVIDHLGTVIADSSEDPATMDKHNNRPEISQALKGTPGTSVRFSKTLQENMLYVAIPLEDSKSNITIAQTNKALDPLSAILRISVPVTAIETELHNVQRKIAHGALAVVVIAALVSLFLSRRITRPLEEMKQSAERFSTGDFNQRLILKQEKGISLEVASLAHSMNEMTDQLNDRIKTIISQRNALEAVFSSMIESVLAVNRDERIMSLNRACADLLHAEQQEAQGKLIQEVVRNVELQEQIRQVLATNTQCKNEIVLQDTTGERALLTNAVPLNDGSGHNIGVLVVMNDVTDIRRLENVRRDFVANVSHELKTPITSIKGYVETLLDGAINDPENAQNFLQIVMKQADRLHAIIEDLLSLSRIEQDAEIGDVDLKKGYLQQVLTGAIQTCHLKASQKKNHISLSCPEHLQVNMNATLLEQAIVNLVVNAIKYSNEGGEIKIHAKSIAQEHSTEQIEISVEDFGSGIAKKHLPRLFERFYRSDKARSRKLGGTGLGLAIVKHIVQAHGGEIKVESVEGKGTTFFIYLSAV